MELYEDEAVKKGVHNVVCSRQVSVYMDQIISTKLIRIYCHLYTTLVTIEPVAKFLEGDFRQLVCFGDGIFTRVRRKEKAGRFSVAVHFLYLQIKK